MRWASASAIACTALGIGVILGIAIVQLRLDPAWRVLSGIEMHLLHTDFTPNWPQVHKEALYKNSPSPKAIVMAGDSLIDYADWPELLDRSDIGNRGITGETSSDLLQRADMLADPGATVALMIGENDLAAHETVPDVCANITRLVDRLKGGHRVILQATLLTASHTLNGPIKDLDSCERQICEAGGRCTFLDINPQVAPAGSLDAALTFDGFHLNHEGYNRWAAALAPVLPKAPR